MKKETLSNGAKFVEDGTSAHVVIFLPGYAGICDTLYHRVARNALVPDSASVVFYESARNRDLLENWDPNREMDSTTWNRAFYNKTFNDEVDEVATFIEDVARRYDSVSLSGYSFGGAVAVALMGREELGLKQVMLTAPQIGLHEVERLGSSQVLYRGFPSAEQLVKIAEDFAGDVTLLHGGMDHIVPHFCSRLIYGSLKTERKQLVVVGDMGHGFYEDNLGITLYQQLSEELFGGNIRPGLFPINRK